MPYVNKNGELKGFRIFDVKKLHGVNRGIEMIMASQSRKVCGKSCVVEIKSIVNFQNGLLTNYSIENNDKMTKYSVILFQNSSVNIDKFLKSTLIMSEDLSFAGDQVRRGNMEEFLYYYGDDVPILTRIYSRDDPNDLLTDFRELYNKKFINKLLNL